MPGPDIGSQLGATRSTSTSPLRGPDTAGGKFDYASKDAGIAKRADGLGPCPPHPDKCSVPVNG
jgi:hypothetical protein